MRCIFCLMEKPPGHEHVFPYAIGGRLTTDRVCDDCNSMLGSRVDAALSDHFLIRVRRAQLGLAGQSGEVPHPTEMLLGVAKLASNPEQRVQVTFNPKTNQLDLKALYHATDVVMPDGTKARRILLDERDRGEIPKIIQRERRRHKMPPLSEDELAAEVARSIEPPVSVERPQLLMGFSVSEAFIKHAMLKITYEMAFLWLGEPYLDDNRAVELRAAILSPDSTSTDRIEASITAAAECDAFKFWPPADDHHLAFSMATKSTIALAVRVFDVFGSMANVTDNPAKYLSDGENDALRFLDIDARTGAMRNVPVMEELLRVARGQAEERRTTTTTE